MATANEIEQTDRGFEPVPHEVELENTNTVDRRHDLDALRAVAMLLGIVLHTALSFAPIPWTVNDVHRSEFYLILFSAIHGFRMPLFFLISGFFTAMLWRKRGLVGLIKQRLKRILLPLVIGCLTIVPAMWVVTSLAAPSTEFEQAAIFDAAAAGDVETLQRAIEAKTISLDDLHPDSGASLLTVAVFCGQTETVEMLLEAGADVNQENRDSDTPLHVAAFMGRADETKLLLEAGANPDTKDGSGNQPKDNLKVDFGTTSFIAQMYGQELQQAELEAGRAEIAQLFGEDPAQVVNAISSNPGVAGLYGLLFEFPLFMHLWFLAFLCWLMIGFLGYAAIGKVVQIQRIPKWLLCTPISLLWLVPLTMIPQHFMMPEVFGPDSSIGLLPIPSVLGYYAIFFFIGAIYWDLDDRDGILGRWWYITLPIALGIVFPVGLELVSGTFGILPTQSTGKWVQVAGNFLQALFVWLMVFGLMGLFRVWLSSENKMMRYVSDSSYWLYLAHLPLVILAQWIVKDLPFPALVKFIGITIVTSTVLLLAYEYLVRYTIIGTMLNGPRKRERTNLANN